MGIGKIQFRFIEKCMNECEIPPHTMLELGNQKLKDGLDKRLGFKTSKDYYKSVGFKHVSFDLNGEDNAIPVDLSKMITNIKYYGYFDVVTNSGTSEHVEPLKKQYECFKNIHLCMKVGGIAIHIIPEYKTYPKHSNIYYRRIFWDMLAKSNGYKILFLETLTKKNGATLLSCCYRKEMDSQFAQERESLLKNIYYKKGNRKPHYGKARL